MQKVVTISESQQGEFEDKVNDYLSRGYSILSTNCGFVQSEAYDFCNVWNAILITSDRK